MSDHVKFRFSKKEDGALVFCMWVNAEPMFVSFASPPGGPSEEWTRTLVDGIIYALVNNLSLSETPEIEEIQ